MAVFRLTMNPQFVGAHLGVQDFDSETISTNSRIQLVSFGEFIGGQVVDVTLDVTGDNLQSDDPGRITFDSIRYGSALGRFEFNRIDLPLDDFFDAVFAGQSAVERLILGGDDLITGGVFDNFFSGLDGDDTIRGKGGEDTLNGGAGDDLLDGGGRNDRLSGDDGDDLLIGRSGADTMNGGIGHDELRGNNGADSLIGGGGRDTIFGNGGDDDIDGGFDQDNLRGGGGDDMLDGGFDTDVIRGNGGDDTIIGGEGRDTLIGGAGADTMIFADGSGDDTVRGFKPGKDLLDVSGVSAIEDFADLAANHLEQAGAYAVISFGLSSLTLRKVDASTLDQDDFIF